MQSGRIIAAAALVASACASLRAPDAFLEKRVAAVLERRGLGADALLVIDNLLAHGPAAPRAVPAVVLELLGRPLQAADAAELFRRTVPAQLASLADSPGEAAFEDLLATYLDELAQAQRLLRSATQPFDEDALLQRLGENLPAASSLLIGVADALDTAQLERANLLFIDATVRFARGLRHAHGFPAEARRIETAAGTIVIGTRGNDRYERVPVRGARFSVIVDPGGDDEYRGADLALHGFSAIIDLSGNDRYAMDGPGLAAAVVGAALLIDFAGNDSYEAKFFAQGAAAFGIGALVDLAGDDRYRIEAWGQGFGLAGGLGLLWDRSGDDRYAAGGVPDPFRRAGGVSGAQGAAFGYRGRLGGGIGILRDDGGDDLYEAQMFAQGLGYYYSLGLLWDRAGNDRYSALQYAQGNGVHQAVGALRDEAGDDEYAIAAGYGQGMGLDVAVGVLVDGGGDDRYRAQWSAQGTATANGFGLLADGGGADRFELGPDEEPGWGRAQWLRGLPSVGVLLHGNGAHFTRGGKAVPVPSENPPVAVQPPTADTCPSPDPGEALLCRVRDTHDLEGLWGELKATLEADPATPLAGWIAIALARRPPGNAEEIAALLAKRESCNVRALALRAWPTLAAAKAGLRSGCFRLQAAARAAYARLGEPLPEDARLPSFLRRIAPQDDTF